MFGSLPRIWTPRRHASFGPALMALFIMVTPSASAGPPRTWTDPADRLLARIHQASGLVTDDFAFCQTMAAGEFVTLAEELRPAGYRPVRVRPYATEQGVLVAALWSRDDVPWEMKWGMAIAEATSFDGQAIQKGYQAIDAAGYVDQGDRYVVLWAKLPRRASAELYLGRPAAESENGYSSFLTDPSAPLGLQSFQGQSGEFFVNGVWEEFRGTPRSAPWFSSWGSDAELTTWLSTNQVSLPLVEVLLCPLRHGDRQRYYRQTIAQHERQMQSDVIGSRYGRGWCRLRLAQYEPAIDDLTFVIANQKDSRYAAAYGFRALANASVGQEATARQDASRFESGRPPAATMAFFQAVLATYLGNGQQALTQLDTTLQQHAQEVDYLLRGAEAYGAACGWLAKRDPDQAAKYAERCVELATAATDLDKNAFAQLNDNAWLDAVQSHPKFQSLRRRGRIDREYLWACFHETSPPFESRCVRGESPEEHLEQCRQLAKDGFHPVSVSAAKVVAGQPVLAASVWHRPVSEQALRAIQLRAEAAQYRFDGNLTKAIECAEQAVALRREVLADSHPGVLDAMTELAFLYRAAGRTGADVLNWAADRQGKAVASGDAVQQTEQAAGFVADHFAFCSAMAADRFTPLAESLRDSGYRPTRVRPYATAEGPRVAAVWTRDELPWRMAFGESAAQVQSMHDKLQEAGYIAVDAAEFGDASNRHVVLWVKDGRPNVLSQIYLARPLTVESAALCRDLGELALATGQFPEALELLQEAVATAEKSVGADDPLTASCLISLADFHRHQGDEAKASPLLKRALAIREKALGMEHPLSITSLRSLASTHREMGDYGAASPLYERLLKITEKNRDAAPWEVTDARLAVRDVQARAGLAPPQRRQLEEADKLTRQARGLHQAGKVREAIALEEQAREIYVAVWGTEHPDTATSLNNLGERHRALGEYAEAEPLARQALEISRKVLGAEHPGTITSLNNLGLIHLSRGDYAQAEPLLRQSVELKRRILGARHPGTATSLSNLGVLYLTLGDYVQAESVCQEAASINRQVLGAEHLQTAISLTNLGTVYASLGDFAKAELLFREALEIKQRLLGADHPDVATSLCNLGEHYRTVGDYAKAEPLLRQALELSREILGKEHPQTALFLIGLGKLYIETGDYAKTESLLQEALKINRKILGAGHPQTATSLQSLGLLYRTMAEYAKAEPFFRQALEINRKSLSAEHRQTAADLSNLGGLYVLLHEYAKAEPLLRQSLEICRKSLGSEHPQTALSLTNLGALCRTLGDDATAQSLYQQALETTRKALGAEHLQTVVCLSNLGELHITSGNFAKAEPFFRQTLEICWKNLERASVLQSHRQQLEMTCRLRHELDVYLSLAVRAGDYTETACQQVIAWKGMVLARQLATRAVMKQPELQPTFAELQSVSTRLATLAFSTPRVEQQPAWQRQITDLSTRKERLEADLASRSAAFHQATRPVTLDDVRAALPTDAALIDFLEYWHFGPKPAGQAGGLHCERHLLVFILRKAGAVRLLDLGPSEPVDTATQAWREGYGISAASVRAGEQLRKLLWEPIEATLEEIRAGLSPLRLLLVSPDGVLGRLPLAALPGRQPGTYLLEDWPLATLPAAQFLLWWTDRVPREPSTSGLLVLGGVDYDSRSSSPPVASPKSLMTHRAPRDEDGPTFAPLSGTAEELNAMERLYRRRFDAAGLKTLRGAAATKAAFSDEAPRQRYLHLATHGFFAAAEFRSALARSSQPLPAGGEAWLGKQTLSGYHPGLLSGLVLAGANHPQPEDDGILTAEEVATLDLSGVDLAVLSACETGLGEVAGGEGLLGLQRTFQGAGARTVIASLWKIPDEETRDLMERFYQNYWERHLGTLESLRAAQLTMLREPPENLQRAAGPRGLTPADTETTGPARRTPPYYWAAFVLSGDWR